MIFGIWILRSGVPIIVRIYEKMKVDETMIGGMLEALSTFASEVASEEIREVVMKNRKFAFLRKDVLIVIYADLETPTPVLNVILNKLHQKFAEKGDAISERDIDDIVEEPIVKIVFIGEANVGKSTLRKLILGEEIPKVYQPTISAPRIEIVNVKGMKLSIWDFPGQEMYQKSWPFFLRSTDIMFVVTDSTLDNVLRTKKLLESLKEHINAKAIYVIANKQDLLEALSPDTIEEIMGIKTLPTIAIDPAYRPIVLKYLENAIYDVLGFKKPTETIDDISIRIAKIEEKINGIENRLQNIEKRLTELIMAKNKEKTSELLKEQ
ncbi:MAG: GTP-binding protein [Candidatus Odinarchaeota archaeon]|nr:GTP-binding protein [Candidatus Odinarchaeota archaeon]